MSVLVELLGTMTTELPEKQLPERTHIWYKRYFFHRLRMCAKSGKQILSPKVGMAPGEIIIEILCLKPDVGTSS